MRFFDYLRMALKNIRRQRLRSGLTVTAVVIGAVFVTVMITLVLSVKSAVENHMEKMGELTEVIVRPSPELAEQSGFGMSGIPPGMEKNYKKMDDNVVADLAEIPHVVAARPQFLIDMYTIRLSGGEEQFPASLLAYEPVSGLDRPLLAGRQLEAGEEQTIIIGNVTLKEMGYENDPDGIIGEKAILASMDIDVDGWEIDRSGVENGMQSPVIHEEETEKSHPDVEVEIVGVISGLEESHNFITMSLGRELTTVDDRVDGRMVTHSAVDERGYDSVLLRVEATDNVEEVAERVENMGLGARTARDFLDDLKKGLAILGLVLGAIGLVSLLIAAIGIINTMVMAIYERTREIGVMRACGARKRTVRLLFTFEAAFIGFLGGVIGVLITYILTFPGNLVANKILESQNVAAGNVVSLPLWLMLGVIGFTTVVGYIAGLYPASRAARLNPVEALRYE